MRTRSPHPLNVISANHSEQFSYITLVHLEDDVVFLKFRLVFNGIPETYLFIRSVGYDKAVQDDVRVAQFWLNLCLQQLMQLYLWIIKSMKIPDALRVNKRHSLPFFVIHPQDEIRIEIVSFKETYSLAALIAQQIYFLASKKVVLMLIIILADMTDESLLTCLPLTVRTAFTEPPTKMPNGRAMRNLFLTNGLAS